MSESQITVIACGHSWGIGVYKYIEGGEEQTGYGFYRPENPYDFFPDFECCSQKEIDAWEHSKLEWDRRNAVKP